MKNLLYILFILLCGIANAQRTSIPDTWHNENPKFDNQGEQEDYWAYKLFRDGYKPQEYDKYSQPIAVKDNVVKFGNTTYYIDCSPQLLTIFSAGILHPEIIGTTWIKIENLEELEFLSTPQIKRYRFWLWRENFMNPQVYLFELQNSSATENTSTEDFIKGSKLTFVKDGWIII
ncbi:MAG: hypothetical protein V4581_18210 [Bacteroidota bacterium]